MTTRFSTEFDDHSFEENDGPGGGPQLRLGRLFRLRWPLMVGVAALIGIPAAVGAWFLTPVEYTSNAEVRFLSTAPRILDVNQARFVAADYRNFVNTQLDLIRGNTVLARVLDQPEVSRLPVLAGKTDRLEYVRGSISARSDRASELATISCRLPDPRSAKVLLDEVLDQYLAYTMSEEANLGLSTLQPLRNEAQKIKTELELLSKRISDKQKAVAAADRSGEGEIELYRTQFIEAEKAFRTLQHERDNLETALEDLKAKRAVAKENPNEPLYAYNVEDRVMNDDSVTAVKSNLYMAEAELEQMNSRMTEQNPLLETQRKRVATLERKLESVKAERRLAIVEFLIAEHEQKIEAAAKKIADGQQELEQFRNKTEGYEARSQEIANTAAELEKLRADADDKRAELEEIQRHINRIQLESEAPARVQMASAPTLPTSPDYMKHFQFVVLALGGSVMVGVAFGLLRELTDEHVRSAQDLSRLTRLPIIAAIPDIKEDKGVHTEHLHLLAADHPESTSADEFRRVLVKLLYPADHSAEVKSLLVTSPTRGDGKTSVSCNLAIAMAQANRRVLLVDLSSRRPEIERVFSMESGPGLSEVLSGEREPAECLRTSTIDGLSILGPGERPQRLAGQLASREMLRFLEWAEDNFDHVILDSPPILLISDGKLLAPVVDGALVVVGAGSSTVGMVQRCLRDLEQVGANVAGVILNKQKMMRGGYLRENLKLYYGYGDTLPGNGTSQPSRNGRASEPGAEPAVMLLPYDESNRKGDSGPQ